MSTLAERRAEVSAKLARLRALLAARNLEAIALGRMDNAAWLTAGGSIYVNEATDSASATLLVTPDRALVVTDPIEQPRLADEDHLEEIGFTFVVAPWYAREAELATLLAGLRAGHDGAGGGADLSSDLVDLRTHLEPAEIARFREVGQHAARAMQTALDGVRPGMTEDQIAARLAAASRDLGGTAVVNLVAADERIARYRHPLPTPNAIQRYVMAVLCLRQYGLVASITRLLHFGPLPDDLRERALAVAGVDAQMILGTQPGRTLGDMFDLARDAYAAAGYPDAITQHHQGGSTGYQPRELLARPGDPTLIAPGQVFAWNPSVRGAKSEDTILLGPDGPEILTAIPGWPTWEITIAGDTLARPAIKELSIAGGID
jgi:Xaa-Pro aminopeptidase